jgi:hypothetical protein
LLSLLFSLQIRQFHHFFISSSPPPAAKKISNTTSTCLHSPYKFGAGAGANSNFGIETAKSIPAEEKAVGEMCWLGQPVSAPKVETERRPEPPEGLEAAFAKLQADYNTLLAGSRAEAANKEKVRIIKPLHGGNKKLAQT